MNLYPSISCMYIKRITENGKEYMYKQWKKKKNVHGEAEGCGYGTHGINAHGISECQG